MQILTVDKKFLWITEAFREAWLRPWGSKLKHLKYRLLWELRPFFKDHGKAPLAVDIEFANECNLRCTMCQQSTNWWNKKINAVVSWDTLKSVVRQCKDMGVYSMKVNWRGESTLDPECAEKIKYIKDQGIHEVQMNTNATKLDDVLSYKLIDSGLDRIYFFL